jgi:hypothetical protein
MDPRVAAYVQYYAREGLVHHVQAVCNEVLKRGVNSEVLFWRAYGLLAEGQYNEVWALASHNGHFNKRNKALVIIC